MTHWKKVVLMMKTHECIISGRRPSLLVKSKEMVEKGYFVEGEACMLEAESVPEPDNDEAVMYE
jgi:hypothetical protein